MESLLGFGEITSDVVNADANQYCSYKLVPWISWDEWESIRVSLFSSSPHSIASALRKIKAWRSRGCLPVVIEVTASIVDIQQRDPFFRLDLRDDASGSEEMLAMLYCMAIMRLVNGVVEKTRKKTEVSIAEVADAINIPRMLVDIRHEGSHRDLPSLRLVRLASIKAIDWLKSYYWEPQKGAIQFQNDGTARLRKEIKSRLYELAFCLQMKQAAGSISSLDKGKRIKHSELFCGRNKFLHLKVGKSRASKSAGKRLPDQNDGDVMRLITTPWQMYFDGSSTLGGAGAGIVFDGFSTHGGAGVGIVFISFDGLVSHLSRSKARSFPESHGKPMKGSKKQITKALKHLVRVYCSDSSEVVSVLVELLLKGSEHSDFNERTRNYQVSHSTNDMKSVFDVWNPTIEKLSNKQPELLLNLMKAVLEMINTREAMKYESEHAISENRSELHIIEKLSELLEWLVKHLKGLKARRWKDPAAAGEGSLSDMCLPKATLVELLRKSLQVSGPGNNRLYDSSLVLAQVIGNSYLIQKLNKLCLLGASNSMINEEKSSFIDSESILAQHEDSIHQASEKFELVKLGRMKSNVLKTTDGDKGRSSRWVVTKSWNSCPIGMLPCNVGFSGRLSVLDCDDDNEEVPNILDSKEERWSLNERTHKRGPECDVELLNDSHINKMRKTEGTFESNGKDSTLSEGAKGHLMIGGVRKKVGEVELLAIKSAVKILV